MQKESNQKLDQFLGESSKKEEEIEKAMVESWPEYQTVKELIETPIEDVKNFLPEEQKHFVKKLEAAIEVLEGKFKIIAQGKDIDWENLTPPLQEIMNEIETLREKKKRLETMISPKEKNKGKEDTPLYYKL